MTDELEEIQETEGAVEVPAEIEELEGQLLEAGFDPSDVEEALYDPAPRRRKHRKVHHRKHKAAAIVYDPRKRRVSHKVSHRRRRYDPAPKRSVTARRTSRKAGMTKILTKLRPYIAPAVGLYSFYAAYQTRLVALQGIAAKNKDGTPVSSVFQAIMFDVDNFNSTDAWARVQAQVSDYGLPLAAGYGVKQFHVGGKYSGIIGDVLMAFGAQKLAKVILDPPAVAARPQVTMYRPAPAQIAAANPAISTSTVRVRSPEAQTYRAAGAFVNPF